MEDLNVSCYVDDDPVNCTSWEKEPVDTKLKERQQMCADLDYLVAHDHEIRGYIIDEYVYLLSDKRFEEMQEFVNKELLADCYNSEMEKRHESE